MPLLSYPLALCIEKNSVFRNAFLASISCHKTVCLVFLFGVTSPLHARAKHRILTLWVIMVSLRETIKGKALDLVRSTSMHALCPCMQANIFGLFLKAAQAVCAALAPHRKEMLEP